MPRRVHEYRCWIISPGDVQDERDAIAERIYAWNAHAGRGTKVNGLEVRIEPVRWETHTVPEMGLSAQDVINKQFGDTCDFGIAVFWGKLGTATKKHPSGSIEEISLMMAKQRPLIVYVCDAPCASRWKRNGQYKALKEQIKLLHPQGLVKHYRDINELRGDVSNHLSGLVRMLAEGAGTVVADAPAPKPTAADIEARVDALMKNMARETAEHIKSKEASVPRPKPGHTAWFNYTDDPVTLSIFVGPAPPGKTHVMYEIPPGHTRLVPSEYDLAIPGLSGNRLKKIAADGSLQA
jgi:hypothetical protein